MDDMWDFGTVRHVSKQSTVGRANTHHNSVHTSNSNYSNVTAHRPPPSPPTTRQSVQLNTNVPPQGIRRTGSEISLPSPVQQKSERLPPLPPATSEASSSSVAVPPAPAPPAAAYDNQATVRNGLPSDSQSKPPRSPTKAKSVSRDLSVDLDDEDEDYGELLEGSQPYPPMIPQHDHMAIVDTAMLDSVVLPAIASVSLFPCPCSLHTTNWSIGYLSPNT